MYCYHCGKQISKTTTKCPYCGAVQPKHKIKPDLKLKPSLNRKVTLRYKTKMLVAGFITLVLVFIIFLGLQKSPMFNPTQHVNVAKVLTTGEWQPSVKSSSTQHPFDGINDGLHYANWSFHSHGRMKVTNVHSSNQSTDPHFTYRANKTSFKLIKPGRNDNNEGAGSKNSILLCGTRYKLINKTKSKYVFKPINRTYKFLTLTLTRK